VAFKQIAQGFSVAGQLTPDDVHEAAAQGLKSVMPRGVKWFKKAASGFAPDENRVLLDDGSSISYRALLACRGIKLDWDAIPGLSETLGKNGVTSNYRYNLAPYTNHLVKGHEWMVKPHKIGAA
jgi:hypothetical protein